LWLASRAARTRLRATGSLKCFYHPTLDPTKPPTVLAVTVTNTGSMTLRIPAGFFMWKALLKREYMTQPPMEFNQTFPYFAILGEPHSYPVEIAPRASETFYICEKAGLESEAKRMLRANKSFLDRLRFWFIRALVQTDDGKMFRVKLSREVRKIWRRA